MQLSIARVEGRPAPLVEMLLTTPTSHDGPQLQIERSVIPHVPSWVIVMNIILMFIAAHNSVSKFTVFREVHTSRREGKAVDAEVVCSRSR